jgi:hypothetical protein
MINLTFISQRLGGQLVVCKVADNIEDDLDHNPIQTLINIETPEIEPTRRRN